MKHYQAMLGLRYLLDTQKKQLRRQLNNIGRVGQLTSQNLTNQRFVHIVSFLKPLDWMTSNKKNRIKKET
jgi:predicted metalloenzyme YecM